MKRATLLAAAAAALVSACGPNGTAGSTGDSIGDDNIRVVRVTMTAAAFEPTKVSTSPGETVKFVFENTGSVKHEAVFGDLDQQQAHHEQMNMDPDMKHGTADSGSMDHGQMSDDGGHEMAGEHGGDEMHAVVIEPGQTVEVVHVVDKATLIGCHEPGHWEAGMKMEVTA